MMLPPVVRVFFAIAMPASVKEVLAEYINTLKKSSKTRVIRWSQPENLHITLQFLPEVKSEDIPTLIASVRESLHNEVFPLSFELGRLQVFPDPYRPRVIVMDVSPQALLAKVAEEIGRGIVRAGYAIEERPFRAHLTLCRIKQPKGLNLGFLSEVEPPHLGQIPMEAVTLFRSEPEPTGSRYTPLEVLS